VRDRDYTISSDFLKRLFAETLHKVELRAIPNERGAGTPALKFVREASEIEAFCERRDEAGIGTYFGVCTRRDDANSGNQSTVMECPALWVDIDCAKQGISGEETLRALQFLPSPPSLIVNSGGGLHAYWLLEEPANVAEGSPLRPSVTAALRQLAAILAGDFACAELARIMRLPGTSNSKAKTLELYDGQPALCEVLEDTGRAYDLEALCEWLGEQRAVLHGTAASEPLKPVREDDPFVAYARQAGYEPVIDVDAELASMSYGAEGTRSIHATQLRVSASMIARGYDDDEIVGLILKATETAAPSDKHWNWAHEEDAIRGMIRTGRAKGYAERKREAPVSSPTPMRTEGNLAVVHDIQEERQKREKPVADKDDRQTQIVAIGQAVIGVWNDRYGPIMHTGGTTYTYEGGVWFPWTEALAQRLRAMIQEACEKLGINPTTSVLNAARVYVMDRPSLHRNDVEFDAHGLLIAEDAALDLRTLEIVEHSPDHFALFKVAACLKGSREITAWKGFLNEAFGDRSMRPEIVSTLQEWYGASIAVTRSRPLLKGMLVHGPSRCSKTQISKVMRALLGEKHICNAKMRDLEGRFGMEPMIGKRGWIADDAIGAKEYLDAETYKVVVTGEDTSAQMKGGKNWEGRFGFPVMLTANNLPRVNDKSDATYNRSLILPMTVVRPEDAPEPVGYDSIAAKIIAEELTGVLWWAMEGRQRLMARGRFEPPTVMRDAGRSFQDSNDPIGSWIRQCVEPCRATKLARKDLSASFNGWWEMESDDGKPFSSNSVTRAIGERFPGLADLKLNGERLFGGIRLNDEGLFAWESRVKSAGFDKKPAFSITREEVNRHWEPEPETAPQKEKNGAKPRF
jgi:P4 family phage/plasmid primase-like protien